jgi:hypothetical protein
MLVLTHVFQVYFILELILHDTVITSLMRFNDSLVFFPLPVKLCMQGSSSPSVRGKLETPRCHYEASFCLRLPAWTHNICSGATSHLVLFLNVCYLREDV